MNPVRQIAEAVEALLRSVNWGEPLVIERTWLPTLTRKDVPAPKVIVFPRSGETERETRDTFVETVEIGVVFVAPAEGLTLVQLDALADRARAVHDALRGADLDLADDAQAAWRDALPMDGAIFSPEHLRKEALFAAPLAVRYAVRTT